MSKLFKGKNKEADTVAMNYFIIRETFRCMACTVEGIHENDAMSAFYKHLGIKEKIYNEELVTGWFQNADEIKKANEKLFDCLFSDTYFRTDSHTLIQMSEGLLAVAYDYKHKQTMLLSDFQKYLVVEILYIRNPKNAILVMAVRRLISKLNLTPQQNINIPVKRQSALKVDLEKIDILAVNYFIIKELYRQVASLRGIKKPIPKFYDKLAIKKHSFEKLIEHGHGKTDNAKEILIRCGFSANYLNEETPELIIMSPHLYQKTVDYRDKNIDKDDKETKLKDFRDFLKTELDSIYNPDGTLLIEATGNLIDEIYPTHEYVGGDFVDIISEYVNQSIIHDYKGKPHYTQEDIKIGVKNAYVHYDT